MYTIFLESHLSTSTYLYAGEPYLIILRQLCFIIVIFLNVIGFKPIGYTFTSIHVAIMSPSISLVNKAVASNSGPHHYL